MANVREGVANSSATDVTLVTTTETVIITSDLIALPSETVLVYVLGWAQLTSGAATTTVTPRLRRGAAITSPLLGEANAETIKTAAGSTEAFIIALTETVQNLATVQYSLTLQQAAATGDGTVLQASILVLIF